MRLVLSHYGGSMKAELASLDNMSWLARIPDAKKGKPPHGSTPEKQILQIKYNYLD